MYFADTQSTKGTHFSVLDCFAGPPVVLPLRVEPPALKDAEGVGFTQCDHPVVALLTIILLKILGEVFVQVFCGEAQDG